MRLGDLDSCDLWILLLGYKTGVETNIDPAMNPSIWLLVKTLRTLACSQVVDVYYVYSTSHIVIIVGFSTKMSNDMDDLGYPHDSGNLHILASIDLI